MAVTSLMARGETGGGCFVTTFCSRFRSPWDSRACGIVSLHGATVRVIEGLEDGAHGSQSPLIFELSVSARARASAVAPAPASASAPLSILFRSENVELVNLWVHALEQAAHLSVDSVYEEVPEGSVGKGQFARVLSAIKVRSRETVAIKKISKRHFWQAVEEGCERTDTLVREATVQAALTQAARAANDGQRGAGRFVLLHDVVETKEHLVLEIELVHGGSLFDHVNRIGGPVPERDARRWVYQLVEAVDFFRANRVAHRDVKPANVLLSSDGASVKVADFGLAAVEDATTGLLMGRMGTPGYVAPEILLSQPHVGYGNNVDMFSVGVVAFTMLAGYEPFNYGDSVRSLLEANKRAVVEFFEPDWRHVSPLAKEFVRRCLSREPVHRLTPVEALEHAWLKGSLH